MRGSRAERTTVRLVFRNRKNETEPEIAQKNKEPPGRTVLRKEEGRVITFGTQVLAGRKLDGMAWSSGKIYTLSI